MKTYVRLSTILKDLDTDKHLTYHKAFLEGIKEGRVLAAPLVGDPLELKYPNGHSSQVDDHAILDTPTWQEWNRKTQIVLKSSSKFKEFLVSDEDLESEEFDFEKAAQRYRDTLKKATSSAPKITPKPSKKTKPKPTEDTLENVLG